MSGQDGDELHERHVVCSPQAVEELIDDEYRLIVDQVVGVKLRVHVLTFRCVGSQTAGCRAAGAACCVVRMQQLRYGGS